MSRLSILLEILVRVDWRKVIFEQPPELQVPIDVFDERRLDNREFALEDDNVVSQLRRVLSSMSAVRVSRSQSAGLGGFWYYALVGFNQ